MALDLWAQWLHNGVMEFLEWLESLPGGATPTTAAKKAGLASPTLLRHAERGYTTADNVIAIARAYGVPPVDALVDLGFLQPDEAGGEAVRLKEALAKASISQLWDATAEKIDGTNVGIGRFPRFDDLTIEFAEPDDLEARRALALEEARGLRIPAQKHSPRLEEPETP